MTRYLLGVDPGLVGTGWCLASVPDRATNSAIATALVAHGTIKPPGADADIAKRLDALYGAMLAVCEGRWLSDGVWNLQVPSGTITAIVERSALAGAYGRARSHGRQLNATAMELNHYATGVVLAALAGAGLTVEHPRVGTRRKETAGVLVRHHWPQVKGPHALDAAHLVLARLLDGRLRRVA